MRATMLAAVFALTGIMGIASVPPSHADEVDVLSGDAFRVGENEWRIANIDAPKLDAICQAERNLARIAQAKLAEFLSQGDMEIRRTGARDENARQMALVRMNGEDVGEKMLSARLVQRHGAARPLCPQGSGLQRFQQMEGMGTPNGRPPGPHR